MSDDFEVQWAHQGGARERPSNTVAAMRRALRAPTAGIGLELDVHCAKGNKDLVVIHDATLERTTNGRGRVRRHLASRLHELDAAWWWTERKVDSHDPDDPHPRRGQPQCKVPSFDQVLGVWRSVTPRPPMTIEIKARRAVTPLLAAIEECSPDERAVITLTSFKDTILWRVRLQLWMYKRSNRVCLSPGAAYMFVFWICAALGIPRRKSRYSRLQIPVRQGLTFATPRLVALAKRIEVRESARPTGGPATMQVDVWTIDDPETMRQLIALGVNGIMTDLPTTLREVVAEQ